MKTQAAVLVVGVLLPHAQGVAAPWDWTWTVPAKWTVVEGTPSLVAPGLLPDPSVASPTTNDVLWRRHQRAVECLYGPRADLALRSAAVAAIPAFPSVPDPLAPAAGGPGLLGDVVDPRQDATELCALAASSQRAWASGGLGGVGIHLINVRQFVNVGPPFGPAGAPSGLLGVAYTTVDQDSTTRLDGSLRRPCQLEDPIARIPAAPLTILVTDSAFTHPMSAQVVADWADLPGGVDVCDWVLAHQIGHALSLFHGNGVDEDEDGQVDEDPRELTTCTGDVVSLRDLVRSPWDCPNTGDRADADGLIDDPTNLMYPIYCDAGGGNGASLTAAQTAAVAAKVATMPGVAASSPDGQVSAPVVMDTRVDDLHEDGGKAPHLDISYVTIGELTEESTFFGSVELVGRIPDGEAVEIITALDLDGNGNTGGSPAEQMSLPLELGGVDVLVMVHVDRALPHPPRVVTVRVFRATDGHLELVEDDSILGDLARRVLFLSYAQSAKDGAEPADMVALGPIVRWSMNSGIRGMSPRDLRTEVITRRVAADAPASDRFVSADMDFESPEFLQCELNPFEARPGEVATLEVRGLDADAHAYVRLGPFDVGEGVADSQGVVSVEFAVPDGLSPGAHLVTMGVEATALTADCRLTVVAPQSDESFVRGDCDGNGEVAGSVTDAVFLLNFNFLGQGGPSCLAACDADGDGEVLGVVQDAVYLLNFSFLGRTPPPPPFPECGSGTDADAALGCDTSACE